jgi:hypothetical protein
MSEPTTEEGRKLAEAITSNVISLWSFDDEGRAMITDAVATVEQAARADLAARIAGVVDGYVAALIVRDDDPDPDQVADELRAVVLAAIEEEMRE